MMMFLYSNINQDSKSPLRCYKINISVYSAKKLKRKIDNFISFSNWNDLRCTCHKSRWHIAKSLKTKKTSKPFSFVLLNPWYFPRIVYFLVFNTSLLFVQCFNYSEPGNKTECLNVVLTRPELVRVFDLIVQLQWFPVGV